MYGLRFNYYNTQPFLESHHPYKQVMIITSEPKMHIQIHTHIYQNNPNSALQQQSLPLRLCRGCVITDCQLITLQNKFEIILGGKGIQ